MRLSRTILCLLALVIGAFASTSSAQTVKIKDIVTIKGNRTNQLMGFGLIAGLSGTGDSPKSLATNQATASLIQKFGLNVTPETVLTQSIAAVVVTADLPAFAKNGDRIDVKVSVVGDASSLVGGTLLSTRLTAGDGKVYVVAQGAILMQDEEPKTVSTIPQAGMVEREFVPNFIHDNLVMLQLKTPDFSTNANVTEAINNHLRGFYASSVDPSLVKVEVPSFYADRNVEFVAELENLTVEVNRKAIVVFNQRTGTIVMGENVPIDRVLISHGNLSIQIDALSKEPQEKAGTVTRVGGATVGQLIKNLNALGLKPQDMISIFQSIHSAGAMQAELKVL